jgi:uncharacterized oligopeptide transporter (OPT) family protein
MSEPTVSYPPRDLTGLQLTVRAIITGMVLGGLLSLCNIYVSLQIGWSTNMSVTGVLLAFALWKAVGVVFRTLKPFGVLENNINQTACSSAASISSAGLVAPIPALTLMTGQELSWGGLVVWTFSVCLVGIACATMIRRQMIIIDKLPFPGGLATAQTLKEVYAEGSEALGRVAMLGVGALIAAAVKLGAIFKLLGSLVVPGKIAGHKASSLGFELEPSLLMVGVGALIGTRAAWSMLAGAILAWGIIAPWAMNAGYAELKAKETIAALPEGVTFDAADRIQYRAGRKLLELRGVMSPEEKAKYLAMSEDPIWRAAVEKLDLESVRENGERADLTWTSHVLLPELHTLTVPTALGARFAIEGTHLRITGPATKDEVDGLLAGVGSVGTEAAEKTTAAVRQAAEVSKLVPIEANMTELLEWLLWPGVTLMVVSSLVSFSFSWRSILRAFRRSEGDAPPSDDGDLPGKWLFRLAAVAMALAVFTQVYFFGIAWWAAALGVALSAVLAVVAARVSGETNITPIGAMGKVTQLTFGAVLPADPAANLMTANVTGGAASQAADLMHDMKTGAMIGSTPWKQTVAQLCGAGAGALAGCAFYLLLIPDPQTQLLTPEWPAPAVATWKAVAELFQRGFEALPAGAANAMLIAGIAGVILPFLDRFAPKTLKPFVPSASSVGLSFVVSPKYAISIFLGAILAIVSGKFFKTWTSKFLVTLASGFIVGDAIVGAGDAILRVIEGLTGAK